MSLLESLSVTVTRVRRAALQIVTLGSAAVPAAACDLALLLAVDVSGSVDPGEYRTQMQGLADGLRDGVVSDALVRAEASVALVQWTGLSRQSVSVFWTPVRSSGDVERLASRIEAVPRKWRNYSTAIGPALEFSAATLGQAPHCARRDIDISGDGTSNEGVEPLRVLPELRRQGITVNALVIEGAEDDLPAYFRDNVITGAGAFVVTANGYAEYPARMRMKLRRETAEQIVQLRGQSPTTTP